MGTKKILAAVMTAGVIVSFAAISSLADSTGWQGNYDEGWRYYTSENEYVKEDWKKIDGNWYFFQDSGLAVIDKWAYVDGKLYHFDSKGVMESNKWISCGEHKVYGDDEDYHKEYDNLLDWRYVGADGAAYTGWKKIGGKWYFFDDGRYDYGNESAKKYALMWYGFFSDTDGSMYSFDSKGQMRSDCWYQGVYKDWFYFGSDGRAYDGWHKINGNWYFFTSDEWSSHFMWRGVYDNQGNGGDIYVLDDNGIMQTGWYGVKIYYDDEETGEPVWTGTCRWYYAKSNGLCCQCEWLNYKGKWYYFDNWGVMVSRVTGYYIDGKTYDFDSEGICTNYSNPQIVSGWHKIEAYTADYSSFSYNDFQWVYVGSDGKEYRNQWLEYKGNHYYFDYKGRMVKSRLELIIDGKTYAFDENGICTNYDQTNSGWVFKKRDSGNDYWTYYDDNGTLYTGWHKINGKWYYFDLYNGAMITGRFRDEKTGKLYIFKDSGEMVTGWYDRANGKGKAGKAEWYYADDSGELYRNKWLKYKNNWYYFDTIGQMVASKTDYKIDGKYYSFDENGICLNPYNGIVVRVEILSRIAAAFE